MVNLYTITQIIQQDIIVSGDSGVISVTGNNGVAVDNNDDANPVVSIDTTWLDDPTRSYKNVQADYTETDPTADSFINNKPTLGTLAGMTSRLTEILCKS